MEETCRALCDNVFAFIGQAGPKYGLGGVRQIPFLWWVSLPAMVRACRGVPADPIARGHPLMHLRPEGTYAAREEQTCAAPSRAAAFDTVDIEDRRTPP